MISQQELNKKVEEINEPLRKHNKLIKMTDTELLSELIGGENEMQKRND